GDQGAVETAAALHQLTQMGTMIGTPDYISPEQAGDARKADIRADIYSLGCTLYTLLAGRAPFGEGSVLEKIKAHSEQEARPLADFRNDVPAEVEAIVRKMLAKDPADRFQTPSEVAAALEKWATNQPLSATANQARARRRALALTALATIISAIAAGVLIYLATDTGRLEINSDVEIPGAKIVLTKNGQEYASFDVEPGAKQQTIRAGDYEVSLSGAPPGVDLDVRSTKRGKPRDYGAPYSPKDKIIAVYRGGGMSIEIAKQLTPATAVPIQDPNAPSEFFQVLGELQAIVRKALIEEGLTVGQFNPGTQVAGPRRLIVLQAEATGERYDQNKVLTALRNEFKALATQNDAFVSSLDHQMHGGVAFTNLPYTTPAREGLIRVTMRSLGTDKREITIAKWRLVIQVEEWPLTKGNIAAPDGQSDSPSQYFERLAGEPLESAVRERVGGAVGRRITSERIPQPPGKLRYEAQIDGVGSKIIDQVFVDLRDVLMRGTGARIVHEGESGIDLRLLRYTTPTHNGEVRVTLISRELGGQPADESTKWLLKIDASEWAKGTSQASPSVVRVEGSGEQMILSLDGAPLTRAELLLRLDALATGDPGFLVYVEGDVVPVTKDVTDLLKDIGATAVGEKNVRFPSEVTGQIMDDAVRRGKAEAAERNQPPTASSASLTEGQIKELVSEAAGIPNDDWTKLTSGMEVPSPNTLQSQTLSLMLFSLRALPPAGIESELPAIANLKKDFQYLPEQTPKPAEIARALWISKSKGYASYIQPEYVTEVTVQVAGDTASGEVAFEKEGLYRGRVRYVARRADGDWRIEEFYLPNVGLSLVRNEQGVWERMIQVQESPN
ncbi:MAG TPA: hypothetical protein VFV87_13595, partial [Pirellulaceae bacterium]|nr:hypothetical protein [Pirellulaceae bacterium]